MAIAGFDVDLPDTRENGGRHRIDLVMTVHQEVLENPAAEVVPTLVWPAGGPFPGTPTRAPGNGHDHRWVQYLVAANAASTGPGARLLNVQP